MNNQFAGNEQNGGRLSEEETKRMFTTLQNTVSNQKVPKPSDDQWKIYNEEKSDWYKIKPKKGVQLKMNLNVKTVFHKEDKPETIKKFDQIEEQSPKLIPEATTQKLTFARKQLLKKPVKSALKRSVLKIVR